MTNPNKEWMDKNVIPLLANTELTLYSFIWNGTPPTQYLVWLNTPDGSLAWGTGVKKLLEEGFRFDYTREPQVAALEEGRVTLFGGDGTPFVDEKGRASVRLFRKEEDNMHLILQVSCLYGGAAAASAVRGFFELFDTNPIEVCSRYATPWGQA